MIQLTHLQKLEAESIHVFREVVATCENPVMLWSIGKDSAVLLHLALIARARTRGHVAANPRVFHALLNFRRVSEHSPTMKRVRDGLSHVLSRFSRVDAVFGRIGANQTKRGFNLKLLAIPLGRAGLVELIHDESPFLSFGTNPKFCCLLPVVSLVRSVA